MSRQIGAFTPAFCLVPMGQTAVFIDSSSLASSPQTFFSTLLTTSKIVESEACTMHKRITSRILGHCPQLIVIYLTGFNQEPSLPLVIHLCQVQQFKEKYNHLSSINCLFFWRQRRWHQMTNNLPKAHHFSFLAYEHQVSTFFLT